MSEVSHVISQSNAVTISRDKTLESTRKIKCTLVNTYLIKLSKSYQSIGSNERIKYYQGIPNFENFFKVATPKALYTMKCPVYFVFSN